MSMTNDHMLYGYRGREPGTTLLVSTEAERADERRAKRALLGQMTRLAGGAVATFLAQRIASWIDPSPAPVAVGS